MTDPFNGHTALLLRVAAVVVPLSLVLSAVAAVGGYLTARDVSAQADRIEAAQADITETRSAVLCPLYAVFLQSDTPQRRAAADDPEAYDAAMGVIRDGAETLRCS